MHLFESPRPLRDLKDSISPEVEAVVLRALEKDPERRPAARELGEEFLAASGIDPTILASDTIETISSLVESEHGPTVESERKTGLSVELFQQVDYLLQSMLESEPDRLAALLKERQNGSRVAEPKPSITPEHWQRMEEIFYSALECEPDRRAAFIEEVCAGDPELRRRVEALIANDEA
jgi:hypothetical protein